LHGVEIQSRVEQRLALGQSGRGDADVDGVGGQTFGGELERRARAGRGFEKKIDDGFAAQGRDFFDLAVGDLRSPSRSLRRNGLSIFFYKKRIKKGDV
jgi:hypothetical protein